MPDTDSPKEIFLICDRKGKASFVSFGLAGMAGMDASAAIGMRAGELMAKACPSLELPESDIDAVLSEGSRYERIREACDTEGRIRTVRMTVSPLTGPGGKVEAALLYLSDVSESARVEEMLEHYAEGLTVLYEISNTFLSVKDRKEVLSEALGMVKEFYGADVVHVFVPDADGEGLDLLASTEAGASGSVPLTRGSIEGRCFKDTCPVVAPNLRAENDPLSSELVPEAKSGIAVPMSHSDRHIGVIGIIYRETRHIDTAELWYLNVLSNALAVYIEKERSLAKLKESENFLHSILEGIGEGVIVVDPEMHIISANKSYLDSVGLELGDVLHRTCHAISHGKSRPCHEDGIFCPVKRVFETGKPQGAMHDQPDSKGIRRNVQVRAYPIFGVDGSVIAVVETLMDITDRIQLERDLEKRVRELEEFYDMAVGRELRMIELKEEVESLREELSKSRNK